MKGRVKNMSKFKAIVLNQDENFNRDIKEIDKSFLNMVTYLLK